MGKKVSLAIFDFDGTLTVGHLFTGIARHHREFKVNRFYLYLYLIIHLPMHMATKARLCSEEKNRLKWSEDLSILFRGFSQEDANEAFNWLMDGYFMPLMRPDIVTILKEHKASGDTVVLLSRMFTQFLKVAAERLGADYAVGTQLEIKDNIYTGSIIKPSCFGENKAKLLKDFINQKNWEVDFDKSLFYADSKYDLSAFRLVGNPIATYPDKELYQIAVCNKWRIIDS